MGVVVLLGSTPKTLQIGGNGMEKPTKDEFWRMLVMPSVRTCENCLHYLEYPDDDDWDTDPDDCGCTILAGRICDVHNEYMYEVGSYTLGEPEVKYPAKKLWEWNGEQI